MKGGTLSARRGLALGYIILAALCGGLFGWGAMASLSGAVIAAGAVATQGGVRAVEHVDGGTVTNVLARDGDRVAAGDVLVRLDGALLRPEAAVLETELHDLVARRNRLEAEFRDAAVVAWSPSLLAAAEASPEVAEAVDGHRRLFEARRVSRDGFKAQLRERITQTRRQIAGFEAQTASLARQAELLAEDLAVQRRLMDSGLTRRSEILVLARDLAAIEGRAGDAAARIAEAQGRIAELETQILQVESRRVEDAEAETREVRAQEKVVRERLAGIRMRIAHLDVRAPATGVVHGLAVSTVGEVLQPGETVAEVVPEGAAFIARVRVEPVHIDQVRRGQEALLRFSAFSQSTTPEYHGTVSRVSADALTDPRGGQAWYEVDVAIGAPVGPDPGSEPGAWYERAMAALEGLLETGGGAEPAPSAAPEGVTAVPDGDAPSLSLAPGMPVEAYLRTGERSPLSYLVKPLTDYFEGAMREE